MYKNPRLEMLAYTFGSWQWASHSAALETGLNVCYTGWHYSQLELRTVTVSKSLVTISHFTTTSTIGYRKSINTIYVCIRTGLGFQMSVLELIRRDFSETRSPFRPQLFKSITKFP